MVLDVRGEICPYPMLKAVEALARLAPGESLEVITDHPPALQTIPAYTSRLGYSSRIEPAGPGVWKVVVSKTEAPPRPQVAGAPSVKGAASRP
ncbi:sulfurtransferase TusA family protein [Carboxydochorda subterranea]|uniref:Sulfurtransferase TusA family protein n=1 Tax=Carboxydichorda subterranea TaxID=3109565 RepID=A0ABZ1BZE3_9FIRM|nr:sulfurtransferase TusA family protein [Limnochorda sp. L945t]WRP18137.1 sulfurtransferase TusA family protein [Limnochorda sp. L945t]